MPTTTSGIPYPGPGDPPNLPVIVYNLAEWIEESLVPVQAFSSRRRTVGAGTSIAPTGVDKTLRFDEDIETENITVTATSNPGYGSGTFWTIVLPGLYQIHARVTWGSASATGQYALIARVNGTTDVDRAEDRLNGGALSLQVNAVVRLDEGDTVEFFGRQDTGSDQPTVFDVQGRQVAQLTRLGA